MFIIELLTCEAIQKKPQIWTDIFKECGVPVIEEITLNLLIEAGLQNQRAKLDDISRRATHQWEIEKKLNLLTEKAKEVKIKLLPYSTCHIL